MHDAAKLVSILFIVSEWVIRIVMPLVVTRKRRPAAAMAWLCIIFFEPWIGLIIYMLIGTHRLPGRRVRLHRRSRSQLAESRSANTAAVTPPGVLADPEAQSIRRLAERLAQMSIVPGNAVDTFTDTQTVIDRLIADIDAARDHVHLLFYIYADDATGRRVADALIRAIHRGVPCRLMVDAVGSRPMLRTLADELRDQGVDVHATLTAGRIRRHLARLDLRNHRKLAVIDGRIGWTGSQNIVDAGYGTREFVWHDLMVRLTGPVVAQLQTVFAEDWLFETEQRLDTDRFFPEIAPAGDIPVQTLPSGPNDPTENYQRLVVTAIHAANHRVTITTPYFVPDEAFLQALESAAMRSLEVDLIVPMRGNMKLTQMAGESYYADLLAAGVRIHQFQKGLLHAKTMTVDESFAFVGSSNFDIRSFALNFELNLVFYGRSQTLALQKVQQQYIAQSRPLTAAEWDMRPTSRRAKENLVRLLSPLL